MCLRLADKSIWILCSKYKFFSINICSLLEVGCHAPDLVGRHDLDYAGGSCLTVPMQVSCHKVFIVRPPDPTNT